MPTPNGEKIRETRQRRGWKLSELARRANVKVKTLANIESGHQVASVELLQRVADELGFDQASALYLNADKRPRDTRPADNRPPDKPKPPEEKKPRPVKSGVMA